MPRRRERSSLQSVSEINITPLMDLTFLLLIVFMITAPMLEYETDVTPPEMSATADSIVNEDNATMVTITSSGDVKLNGTILSHVELTETLISQKAVKPELKVLLRAHGERAYNEIIEVMKAVKSAGINNLSFVTKEE